MRQGTANLEVSDRFAGRSGSLKIEGDSAG